jgi:peroxiredoxin
MRLDWDSKATWHGLWSLLLVLGIAWIVVSRSPVEAAPAGDAGSRPQEGFVAPDFVLHTLDGQEIALATLRGKAVLINFWATWCPPCRTEMPAIQQVHEQYRDQGLVVLAISLQQRDAETAAFVEEMGLTFPILRDSGGSVSDVYRVTSLPTTFFLDRDGVIHDVEVGGPLSRPLIESKVAPLLGQPESD